LKHSEKVLGVTFISNDQTPEVLQLGEQPLDFPPSPVSFQPTSVLSQIPSVSTMWGNDFNAVESQFGLEAVEVLATPSRPCREASLESVSKLRALL